MAKDKVPVTPAVRVLRAEKVAFTPHLYAYEDKGGTAVCARELGFSEHAIIKTLVMEDDRENPLIVLMHGDRQVSTRELARILGVKSILPCSAEKASRLTGYLVGGTSPFGTKRVLPVYMEEAILDLPRIYINGGKRGFLVGISPQDAERVLKPVLVHVASQAD
ncbi:MAG: Cys-tRNA(Pro) deacylase [Deltaproteobacteria bacterium]|nr:Cys-tRNA(Pro) deacylase [Deltaproteobacteria bacterium]